MPLQFVAQGPMLIPAVGQTFPDAVAGLVGSGASYTGWWGLRAYSQAVATAGIRACILSPALAGGGNVDIHLDSTGRLNNSDLNLVDFSGAGAIVVGIDNQVSGGPLLFAHNPRPHFFRNYYQTNHHAMSYGALNTCFDNDNDFTWPASTSGFLWTAYLKYVTGAAGTDLMGDQANSDWRVRVNSSGNVTLAQDAALTGFTINGLIVPDTPAACLFHFNGASSAINKDGTDNTFNSGGSLGIATGSVGMGTVYGVGGSGAASSWSGNFLSEFGYMSATKTTANTIDATKRAAIVNEMKGFYT